MKKLFALAAVAASLTIAGGANISGTEIIGSEIYPAAAVVVGLDNADGIVTVATGSGLLYEFYDYAEDWEIGDMVGMIMDDSGTPDTVLDDKIISARYVGFTELFDMQVLEVVEHQYE